MSSIKRDVKKKAPPRPEARFLSRDPAHCSFILLEKIGLLSILVSFSVDGDAAVESERAASETGCFRGNHGSIRGSWPMAISGYPRGHNVIWVTRCQSTRGRSHGLMLLSNRASPEPNCPPRERIPETESLLHRRGSSCLPMPMFGVETHSFLPYR